MPSAFAAFQNATVTFLVADAGVVTDPDTGNVFAAQKQLVVKLFLKADKVSPLWAARHSVNNLAGVDIEETLYQGYTVEPQFLPTSVVVGTTGSLVFAGNPAVDCEITELGGSYGTLGAFGEILTNAMGTSIKLVARGQI